MHIQIHGSKKRLLKDPLFLSQFCPSVSFNLSLSRLTASRNKQAIHATWSSLCMPHFDQTHFAYHGFRGEIPGLLLLFFLVWSPPIRYTLRISHSTNHYHIGGIPKYDTDRLAPAACTHTQSVILHTCFSYSHSVCHTHTWLDKSNL